VEPSSRGFLSKYPEEIKALMLFNLTENDVWHGYQISVALQSPAVNLLNEGGDSIVSDDD